QKGIRDAFGVFHSIRETRRRNREKITREPVKPFEKPASYPTGQKGKFWLKGKDFYDAQQAAFRSLLAYEAQSYELALLLPLVPIMRNNKQIYLIGYLFDAIIVELGNVSKRERHIKQFQKAVDRRATELDIPTRLGSKLLTTH